MHLDLGLDFRLTCAFPMRSAAAETAGHRGVPGDGDTGRRDDLIKQLHMDDPERVLAGFDRPNLRFLAKYCRTPSTRLPRSLRRSEGIATAAGSSTLARARRPRSRRPG
ncbi:MAG: hypothetical protein R2849_15980 [Thermomicrobiales bacterium]